MANGGDAKELYVGYLPIPKRYLVFVVPTVVVMVLGALFLAVVTAAAQRDPGTGRWETAGAITVQGFASADPYPIVRVFDGLEDGIGRDLLIVSQGKLGAWDRVMPLAGQPVKATGFLIEREGTAMLELVGGLEAVEPLPSVPETWQAGASAPSGEVLGSRTLKGEIVDSKCYLGVMKPGEGRAHKACATLCVRGGIPPVFRVKLEDGRRLHFVLTGADGAAADLDTVLPLVADPVEATGIVERRGSLLYFKADPADIARL
jgi:hypothetical protein